jgi:hypothetical protein
MAKGIKQNTIALMSFAGYDVLRVEIFFIFTPIIYYEKRG